MTIRFVVVANYLIHILRIMNTMNSRLGCRAQGGLGVFMKIIVITVIVTISDNIIHIILFF